MARPSFYSLRNLSPGFFPAHSSAVGAAPDPSALVGQTVRVTPAAGGVGFTPLNGVIDSVVLAFPPGAALRLSVTITP